MSPTMRNCFVLLSSPSTTVPPTAECESENLQSGNFRRFHFKELQKATMNFRLDGLLGDSRFGPVYKGWVDEATFRPASWGTGKPIAVKKLNQGGTQGHSEWLAEVNYLGQLSHPNLVKLLGYCNEDRLQCLLIYEFMSQGSLANHLFRSN